MAHLYISVIQAKQLKNGKHKLKIALTHKGKTRYKTTDYVIDDLKQFKNGQVVKRPDADFINVMLRKELNHLQEIISHIDYVDCLSMEELCTLIKHEQSKGVKTLKQVYTEYCESRRFSDNTLELNKHLFSSITQFISENKIIRVINYKDIVKLEKSLFALGNARSTVSMKLSLLQKILAFARRAGYMPPINPFSGYRLPKADVRPSWLSKEQIIRLRDADFEQPSHYKCRDLFMLSFYLGGINVVDLMQVNFNETNGVLHYVRTKTEHVSKINKFVEFEIQPEAQEIIDRLKDDDGHIMLTRAQKDSGLHWFFRDNMKQVARQCGLEHLIYYAARKSFAQLSFKAGIPTCVINYILGHKVDTKESSLFSYIYVTPEMATKAMRKVFDSLK